MIPHSRPTLGVEEKKAVEAVLDSGQIAQGEKVIEFEKTFCEWTGRHHAVAVSSGTAALQLSLSALGISRDDEIILPSFTCVALLHVVEAIGARPVLVDIDLDDFNISLEAVKKRISRKTKAAIVPHAFGRTAQMAGLQNLRIPLVEDGTQALGARVGEKPVGSFGILSIFSFYATKMIATGEGGMIVTDSRRLADELHDLRDYDKKEDHRFRTNSKMTDLEAALGIVQMKKLPQFIQRRREIAFRYRRALKDSGMILPAEETHPESVYYRFVIRIPKGAKEWTNRLRAQGVDVKEPVYKPLHQYLDLPDSQFPATAKAFLECRSLPIYPSLSDEECDQICRALRGEPNYVEI